MNTKEVKNKVRKLLGEYEFDVLQVRNRDDKLYLTISIKGIRSATVLTQVVNDALHDEFYGAFITSARGATGLKSGKEQGALATFRIIP